MKYTIIIWLPIIIVNKNYFFWKIFEALFHISPALLAFLWLLLRRRNTVPGRRRLGFLSVIAISDYPSPFGKQVGFSVTLQDLHQGKVASSATNHITSPSSLTIVSPVNYTVIITDSLHFPVLPASYKPKGRDKDNSACFSATRITCSCVWGLFWYSLKSNIFLLNP